MELKIEQKKEQPLLSRTMLTGMVGFSEKTTPSRADLRKQIASAMKVEEGLVAVPLIKNKFGERVAKFQAHVYKNPADLEKFEASKVLVRHGLRQKKAKAAKEKK